MRTNWKKLKGKDVLVRSINRQKWVKTYGDLREVRVLDSSPSGICAKLSCGPYSVESAEWVHRDAVKLVEVLE